MSAAVEGMRVELDEEEQFQRACDEGWDCWIPACGGTEVPFPTKSGRRLLYAFNPWSGKHAFIDVEADRVLTEEEVRAALGMAI